MSGFKVGDKVRVTVSTNMCVPKYREGAMEGTWETSFGPSQLSWWLKEYEIEKIEDPIGAASLRILAMHEIDRLREEASDIRRALSESEVARAGMLKELIHTAEKLQTTAAEKDRVWDRVEDLEARLNEIRRAAK